jgi:hypothetical protein
VGMIAFNEGDELNGKKYLTRSMTADPTDNLSKFYWEKYTKEEINPSVQKQKTNLNREYYFKFQKWYHTYPVNFDDLIFLLI